MPKVKFLTALEPELIKDLEEIASTKNRSRNNLIETYLIEAVKREKAKSKK